MIDPNTIQAGQKVVVIAGTYSGLWGRGACGVVTGVHKPPAEWGPDHPAMIDVYVARAEASVIYYPNELNLVEMEVNA